MTTSKSPKEDPARYSGMGIMFTVYDQNRDIFPGPKSTKEVIARAIDEALDAGYETSDEIATFLTTTSFPQVKDRVARFNSILKAGDVVGAQLTAKLWNAYEDLLQWKAKSEREGALDDSEYFEIEARGFAEAMTIMYSPFSVEDSDNPKHVDWEMVTHLADLMEEQHQEAVVSERLRKAGKI